MSKPRAMYRLNVWNASVPSERSRTASPPSMDKTTATAITTIASISISSDRATLLPMSVDSYSIPDEITSADLVDAMGRMHRHRCHILDLVSLTPGRRLMGIAATISYFPTCSAALDPGTYKLR